MDLLIRKAEMSDLNDCKEALDNSELQNRYFTDENYVDTVNKTVTNNVAA